MRPTPIFFASVTRAARLTFDEEWAVRDYLLSKAGKQVEVVIRPRRRKRSLEQNAYWHAVPVRLMAEYMGEDHMATHYALLGECFGYHYNERLKRAVPNKGSSKALTVEDFSHLIEWCPPWALNEHGVQIPLPNECEYDEIPVEV